MKLSPLLALVVLLVLAFTLATGLASRADGWSKRTNSDNVFGMMFGDGRKLFANQFFTMADVYFHSGYYPSVFDRSGTDSHITEASRGTAESEEEESKADFYGKPKDWVEAFGRHFRITQHTHLEGNNEREILPWLRLAADLDPQKTETFTVGAYFLREHMGNTNEAEAFLREGLRHNPDSCEILFELGRLYQDKGDLVRARNVWQLGAKKYAMLDDAGRKYSAIIFDGIVVHLARLEDQSGNYAQAIQWFQIAQTVSPAPELLQSQIDAIQKKLSAAATNGAAAPR